MILKRALYIILISASTATMIMGQSTTQSPASSEQKSTSTSSLLDKAPPAELSKEKIPVYAKVYIAPLNGYESFIVAAVVKKNTPITVVNSRDKADYEITGVSETQQAGWAKMLFFGS